MRTIYLVHVTGDETHFLALYKYAQEYGYTASHQIILKKMAICRRLAINIKRGDCFKGISTFLKDVFMHFRLYILKDKDLIVGIAPYDRVMNKYKWIFMRNRCFYFTSDHHWCSPYPSVGDIKNRERYEAILKQCFRGIFCVSKETESQVKKFGLPTSVVNHAVDHDMYKKRIKRGNGEKKSYVFVGSYNERKNVRLILSWLEANPDVELTMTFIGHGPLNREIDHAAMGDGRIINIGECTKIKLQNILCTFDFMILPSKEEPFGIVLLEALSSGTPCIVSNAIGPSEIIENGVSGYIFDLSEGIQGFDRVMKKSLAINDRELNDMRSNALKYGETYSPEQIIKRWVILLEDKSG